MRRSLLPSPIFPLAAEVEDAKVLHAGIPTVLVSHALATSFEQGALYIQESNKMIYARE